jgi:hypothetical protein
MDQRFSFHVKEEGVVNILDKSGFLRDSIALNCDVLDSIRTPASISTSLRSSVLAVVSFRVTTCTRRPNFNPSSVEDLLLSR